MLVSVCVCVVVDTDADAVNPKEVAAGSGTNIVCALSVLSLRGRVSCT